MPDAGCRKVGSVLASSNSKKMFNLSVGGGSFCHATPHW